MHFTLDQFLYLFFVFKHNEFDESKVNSIIQNKYDESRLEEEEKNKVEEYFVLNNEIPFILVSLKGFLKLPDLNTENLNEFVAIKLIKEYFDVMSVKELKILTKYINL